MAKRKPGEKVKEKDPAILAFQAKEKARKEAAQKKRDEGSSRAKKVGNAAVKANEKKATEKKAAAKKKAPAKKKTGNSRADNFLSRAIDKRKAKIKQVTGL